MKRKATFLKHNQAFSNTLTLNYLALSSSHESSDGVEPEIDFSPVTENRYEQYSSELCVFPHKSESVGSLERGTVQGLCRVK